MIKYFCDSCSSEIKDQDARPAKMIKYNNIKIILKAEYTIGTKTSHICTGCIKKAVYEGVMYGTDLRIEED